MLVLILFSFLIGLFLGSFLLVVADRSGNNTSFIRGRSKCDNCGHVLSWYELVPVVSYILQGGKCSHCQKKLSLWYPASEILTGLMVALVFLSTFSLGLEKVILYELITLCLIAVCFADIKYEIIPFSLIITASLASLVLILVTSPEAVVTHLLAAGGASAFFLIIFLVTKGRGMGFGDVVYVVFMGLLLGYPFILFGLYLTFILGALISLVLIAMKKRKLHGGTIPFGPFLVLGTFIMMLWGDQVVKLVTSYLR